MEDELGGACSRGVVAGGMVDADGERSLFTDERAGVLRGPGVGEGAPSRAATGMRVVVSLVESYLTPSVERP